MPVERLEEYDTGRDEIWSVRLSPDMFPLVQQIITAVDFSWRAHCPLAQTALPDLGSAEEYTALKNRMQRAIDFIGTIPLAAFDGFEVGSSTTRAGFADCHFSGAEFVYPYALPNFQFHSTVAYTIARAEGVPLGKRDFDGFHDYSPGFTFSRQ